MQELDVAAKELWRVGVEIHREFLMAADRVDEFAVPRPEIQHGRVRRHVLSDERLPGFLEVIEAQLNLAA